MNVQTTDSATAVADTAASTQMRQTGRQALPPAEELPDELLTVMEAARYLKVCKQTVYNHLVAGRLRAFYVGSVRRIPRAELLEYLNGGSTVVADATAASVGAVHE